MALSLLAVFTLANGSALTPTSALSVVQRRGAIGELDGQMDRHAQSVKQSLGEAANGLAAMA